MSNGYIFLLVPANWEKLQLVEKLGKGGFGTVWKTSDLDKGHEYAVKRMNVAECQQIKG